MTRYCSYHFTSLTGFLNKAVLKYSKWVAVVRCHLLLCRNLKMRTVETGYSSVSTNLLAEISFRRCQNLKISALVLGFIHMDGHMHVRLCRCLYVWRHTNTNEIQLYAWSQPVEEISAASVFTDFVSKILQSCKLYLSIRSGRVVLPLGY